MSDENRLALTVALLTAATITVIGVMFLIDDRAGFILACASFLGLMGFAFVKDMAE